MAKSKSGDREGPAPAEWFRTCNRCNVVRPGSVGFCPGCGCPEFRLTTAPPDRDRS